jgi:hypothetical protein
MITSICSGSRSNSHLASITSSPLFISDAESIVTFVPIFQLGWLRASLGVTLLSCSRVRLRKGPPDAVRVIFSSDSLFSPTRHWNIAECSESTGIIFAPVLATISFINDPATTNVSLFARATFLPVSRAEITGFNPA